jgi:hypothetical protein
MVHAAVGRRRLGAALQAALNGGSRAAARLGVDAPASALLSAAYNLAYYRGLADELGDRARFQAALGRREPSAAPKSPAGR